MKHRNLGQIDGDLVVFGGPYSNRQALEALCQRARDLGVPPNRMICTGDAIAYCGAPGATLARLMQLKCPVVAGNCEIQLAADAPDCGCGFEAGTACDLLSDGWYGFARGQVTQAQRQWMAALPGIISFQHAGARYAVVHGGMPEVAQFLWPTDPEAAFERVWDAVEDAIGPVDHILAGHCGLAFQRDLRRGRWINGGVIGMPPHDGDSATRFAVLRAGALRIERLTYDVAGAVADMRGAGLPPPYRLALESGYWPSEDVLPAALRVAVSDRG